MYFPPMFQLEIFRGAGISLLSSPTLSSSQLVFPFQYFWCLLCIYDPSIPCAPRVWIHKPPQSSCPSRLLLHHPLRMPDPISLSEKEFNLCQNCKPNIWPYCWVCSGPSAMSRGRILAQILLSVWSSSDSSSLWFLRWAAEASTSWQPFLMPTTCLSHYSLSLPKKKKRRIWKQRLTGRTPCIQGDVFKSQGTPKIASGSPEAGPGAWDKLSFPGLRRNQFCWHPDLGLWVPRQWDNKLQLF